jgi:hypothetical protein
MASRKRRKLTAEDIPEIKDTERNVVETLIPDTEELQRVDFGNEQEFRSDSNGFRRTVDLVDGTEVGSGNPPDLPDENDFHGDHHHKDNRPQSLRYFLAGVYIAAGMLSMYVGITMVRDLRKDGK